MISKVLPGEFLSRAVNAVALVDTTNLGEVYNAVAAIRIGRWCQLCRCWGCWIISWVERHSWGISRGECECPASFMFEKPIWFSILHGPGPSHTFNLSWWRVVSDIWHSACRVEKTPAVKLIIQLEVSKSNISREKVLVAVIFAEGEMIIKWAPVVKNYCMSRVCFEIGVDTYSSIYINRISAPDRGISGWNLLK